MRIFNDIISKEVLDNSANIIGKVKDVIVDTTTNKIESLILINTSAKRSFGKKEENETIIPFENIITIGDKIIIKDDMNELYDMIDEINNL